MAHQDDMPTADDGIEADRRGSLRRRVLKSGVIVGADGDDMRCHVLNLSDTGALLMPADIAACPDEFILRLAAGPPQHCAVAWRKDATIGVRFIPTEHAVVSDNGARIHLAVFHGESESAGVDLDPTQAIGLAGRLIDAAYRRLAGW